MQINYFDVAIVLLLAAFALRGGLRGFIEEVAGLVGLVVGLILARTFIQPTSALLSQHISPTAAPAAAFILLVIAGMLGVAIVARLLRAVLNMAFAGWLDKLLGVGAGLFKGLLLCVLVAYAASLLVPHFPFMQNSQTLKPLLGVARWIIESLQLNIPTPV